jgi:hypothetical protein
MFADLNCLSDIARSFAEPDVKAVYGDIVMVDPSQPYIIRRYWRPGPYEAGACLRGWMAPHPTFYVRRDLLMSIGGFNLDYRLQADFDLELRLFECMQIRAKYLPRTFVRMRMGGATTGSIRNIIKGNLEAAESVRQNGFVGGWRFVASKLLRKIPQYWMRPKILRN